MYRHCNKISVYERISRKLYKCGYKLTEINTVASHLYRACLGGKGKEHNIQKCDITEDVKKLRRVLNDK